MSRTPVTEVTLEQVKKLFSYDPDSGVFTRLISTSRCVKVGQVAGSMNGDGYLQVKIDGHRYTMHRLAWLYVNGEWPKGVIDHLNGHRADNRIANLRDTTQKVNAQNKHKARSDSASRLLGVYKEKRGRRYRSHIWIDGRLHVIGYFDTKEEAHAAYVETKRLKHEGCTI